MKKFAKVKNPWMYVFLGALVMMILLVVLGVAAWTAVKSPVFASILNDSPASVPQQDEVLWAQVEISKPVVAPIDVSLFAPQVADTPVPNIEASPLPTVESLPVPTSEPTLAPTDEPTSIPTEAPTSTPESTETPAQLSMEILADTPTSEYVPPPTSSAPKPQVASSGNSSRWIDVDLTNQAVYAYEGDVVVNSFIVSTGTWATPTVTGQYKVYVKYRSTSMSGPGYYLPDVPYVMYFYKGYGLHGTYWHNNFGTPMSHGCVNLRTDDAGWLFNWASVGTVVNVHY